MEHDELSPRAGDATEPSPAITLDDTSRDVSSDGLLIEIEESLTIELVALVEPNEPDNLGADPATSTLADAATSELPRSSSPTPTVEAAPLAVLAEGEPDPDGASIVRAESAATAEGFVQGHADQDATEMLHIEGDTPSEVVEPEAFSAFSDPVDAPMASAESLNYAQVADRSLLVTAAGEQAASATPAPDSGVSESVVDAVMEARPTAAAPKAAEPLEVVATPVDAPDTPVALASEKQSEPAAPTEVVLVFTEEDVAPPEDAEDAAMTAPFVADAADAADAADGAEPDADWPQIGQPPVALDDISAPAHEAAPAVAVMDTDIGATGSIGSIGAIDDALPGASAAEQPDGEPSLRVVEALRRDMRAAAALRRDPHARATRPLPRRHRRARRHRLALSLIEILLVLLVSFAATFVALDAHARLNQARLLAHDGLQHIEDVRTLFAVPDKFAAALNTTTLARAQSDLTAAQGDFARLRVALRQGTFGVAAHTPFASSPFQAAANLAAAADEACQGGLFALHGMQLVAPIVAGGVFSGSKPPGSASTLTTTTIAQLTAALDGALHHLDLAVAYAQQANLTALPASLVSAQQRQELQEAIAQWPALRPLVLQARGFLAGVPALLGLTTPANYLIELMDRTELRPGGGFIGNYAVMTIANGKIEPFTISDTYLLDKPYLSAQGGQVQAPAAFSWWRWASYYGLRDSNFSADFPTTAQLGMQQLAREGGHKTQGVIALTVPAIARVLQVTGSISMPLYNQTVTSQNLEYLIHYYQEAVGHDPLTGLPRSDLLSSSRKRFTALLARTLLDKLHSLSSAQLLAIGKGVLTSLRLKEVQVYVTVPQAESLLTSYGLDGGVSHGPGDGVAIVDANATANKANQFVNVTYRDTVTLDSQGTATHQLTITYQFNVTDPGQLFGEDLYEDYLRIYVPPGAQLTHIGGLHNTFGQDQINHSDLAWRQMWGGYVLVQDGTPYVLQVSWHVAHAATRDAKGNWIYALIYQHQAGANQVLILSVGVPGQHLPAIQYNATLDSDRSFTATYRGA